MPARTPVVIRSATPADAELLTALGRACFHEAFAAQNSAADMAAYLADRFNVEQVATELFQPGAEYFVADCNGEAVGYAKVETAELRAPIRTCCAACNRSYKHA